MNRPYWTSGRTGPGRSPHPDLFQSRDRRNTQWEGIQIRYPSRARPDIRSTMVSLGKQQPGWLRQMRPAHVKRGLEAPSGFEPLSRSFADCSLSHLGTAPREWAL